jgi:hypothetical protein
MPGKLFTTKGMKIMKEDGAGLLSPSFSFLAASNL